MLQEFDLWAAESLDLKSRSLALLESLLAATAAVGNVN